MYEVKFVEDKFCVMNKLKIFRELSKFCTDVETFGYVSEFPFCRLLFI